MGKKSRSGPGSGMNIPDHISESIEKIFGLKNMVLKFFDADSGSGIFLTLDLGWKKFGSWTRDKHPGSETLLHNIYYSTVRGTCSWE
jgi:hypothetical protein